jgi:hypothetical protein
MAESLRLYAELAAAAERVRAAHDRLRWSPGPTACTELLEAERFYLELRASARECTA